MWDPNSFIKDDIWCDDTFVIVKGHWRNTVGDFYMINIYGPQDSLAKAILWNRIGDFMHQHADNFNSFIDNSGLIDLPLGGRLFTWMNNVGTKLNHNPILLHVSKSDFGLAPFKIFHSWLLRDSFDEVTKTKLPKLEENNFRRKLLSHEKIQDKIEAGSANDDDHDARKKFKDYDSNVEFPLFANSSGLCALDRDSLETPISLDEVKNAVWDCGSSKAPGPDGFSFAFVKKYWDYIKVDILEYVNIFLDTGSLSHVSNSSFFTLIPKVRIEKTKRSKNDQKPTRNGKKTKSQEQE
ncbi:hypothetical protein Tco_0871428 [Tanacetum coccineum]